MSELRKSVGALPLIALGVAGVLGTSWIYTNGTFFAKYGAGGEVFGLALGALFAAFIALAYAELAASFPRAGGEVVYSYLAFNRPVGFLAGWLLIGAYISSLAFYVSATGFLLSWVFPGLKTIPLYTVAGSTVYLPVLLIGIALALIVCLINCFGMRLGAGAQLLFFVTMLVIGAALTVAGFAFGAPGNFWPPYEPGSDAGLLTLRFILPAMTFLTGFSLVAIMAEDANIRPRNIGKLVVSTVVLAGTFYCVVLLASAWIIPWQQTAGLDRGTISAFTVAGFPGLGWSAYVISVLGLLTSFLALFVATSRLMLAMSRAGLFPRVFAQVHPRWGTPVNALVFTLVLSVALGWLGRGAITWFLDTGGVYIGLAWLLGVLSMYQVRRRYPHLRSPYRTKLSALPAVGAIAATLVIILSLIPGTNLSIIWPQEYAILLAWLVLGVVIYAVTRRSDDESALRSLLGDHYDKLRGSQRSEAPADAPG